MSPRPRINPRSLRYHPPSEHHAIALSELLNRIGRAQLNPKQLKMFAEGPKGEVYAYYAGALDLIEGASVSIVGTREVTDDGWTRAAQLAKRLSQHGVTVVSGLAKGVDTAALTSAIDHGGHVAAVIGTPLDKAYPAENAELQQMIYRHHLLISPFAVGERVYKSNFPARNRVMAAITDATVIIEASDTSGTLHQASECVRLGRWLFIARSVFEDRSLTWPAKFVGYEKTMALDSVEDILLRVGIK